MPSEVPTALTFSFYALVAWGLSAVLVAFRILAPTDRIGIIMRILVVLWLGVPAALGSLGVLAGFDASPPLLMRMVALMSVGIVIFVFSKWGKKAAETLPSSLLIGTQAFRFPLELVLLGLARNQVVPIEMTLAGYNFDILTGVTALFLWIMVRRGTAKRWMLWSWNVAGMLLLLTIVAMAMLSFPKPFGWFEPQNRIVAYYPWVLLPTFLVQVALVGHLLLFRKLATEPEPEPLPNI